MASDTISAATRVRVALLSAIVSILIPAMAQGATRNVDKASAACSDTAGAPFCTIQAAVNAASPNDRIEIAAGSYIETLTVDRNLTLHGVGISSIEGACDGQTNLLGAPAVTVQTGVIVLLTDVTIKGGTASLGGGIANAGVLFLASSEVCQNNAFNQGGGIYSTGALSLSRVQVYDNQQASAGVEGGGLMVAGGRTLVRNSTFTNNRVARGGAISVAAGATLVLSRSTLKTNFADGTLPAVVSSQGGGINNSGTTIIDQTDVDGNVVISTGGFGGGIFNDGDLLMAHSVLRDNGTDHIAGNPIANGFGGGLYNTGLATISSSTVSGNVFAFGIVGFGAGISNVGGTLSLSNVTITENANAGTGVGGGAGIDISGGSVRVRNSIIARQAVGDDCSLGGLTTDGYNIDSDGTCGLVSVGAGGTDQPSVADPGLLPLTDNGGPTQTHDLADTSVAIDAGNPAGCMGDLNGVGAAQIPLRADQRGRVFIEIAGVGADPSSCDIGAVEFQPAP
ncbi:MAG TPA: choice-of-anchor Q domain-containing protein [Dongiaceae bacterium]|nr:choice-of-anchor Q domain-containing protein [Dongiaceae bacterium]